MWPEVIRVLDAILTSLPQTENPNEEESDEDFQTGITSDTNDADDDGDDADETDYDDAHSTSSASSSPSPSPSILPRHSPQPPYFLHQYIGIAFPFPLSSSFPFPTSSLSPKKTALRLVLNIIEMGT